jgi:hypothetical protein
LIRALALNYAQPVAALKINADFTEQLQTQRKTGALFQGETSDLQPIS